MCRGYVDHYRQWLERGCEFIVLSNQPLAKLQSLFSSLLMSVISLGYDRSLFLAPSPSLYPSLSVSLLLSPSGPDAAKGSLFHFLAEQTGNLPWDQCLHTSIHVQLSPLCSMLAQLAFSEAMVCQDRLRTTRLQFGGHEGSRFQFISTHFVVGRRCALTS